MENIIWLNSGKVEILTKNLRILQKNRVTEPLIYGKILMSKNVENRGASRMEEDKLNLSAQDALAVSAALRLPLTDLFARIRSIAAHEEMLTPFLRQELEGVLRDGYRLLRLADSLSAAEGYVLEPSAAVVFPLWEELRECLESARLLLGQKGYLLRYSLPEEPDMVRGEPEMLFRATLHLISNALNATGGESPVTVRGAVTGGQAVITVTDEGCGIPRELMETVFEPYESRDRNGLPFQSPGLGLPLARRVLEAHGGSLRLVSGTGGTAAICSLPLTDAPRTLKAAAPQYLEDLFSPLYTVLCDYLDPPWPYPQP